MSCYFNHEVECCTGDLIRRHPELTLSDMFHCSKCGWNPEVERKRREEVRERYGKQLQKTIY